VRILCKYCRGFIGRFEYYGNEWNWTNSIKLVFAKTRPQRGIHKNWKYVFQTFQFRLNCTRFVAIFGQYITKAQIIYMDVWSNQYNNHNNQIFPIFTSLNLARSLLTVLTPSLSVFVVTYFVFYSYTLRFHSDVFCFVPFCCLFVCTYAFKFIAGVPLCGELECHPITVLLRTTSKRS